MNSSCESPDSSYRRGGGRPRPEVQVYRPGSGPLRKSSSNVENIQPISNGAGFKPKAEVAVNSASSLPTVVIENKSDKMVRKENDQGGSSQQQQQQQQQQQVLTPGRRGQGSGLKGRNETRGSNQGRKCEFREHDAKPPAPSKSTAIEEGSAQAQSKTAIPTVQTAPVEDLRVILEKRQQRGSSFSSLKREDASDNQPGDSGHHHPKSSSTSQQQHSREQNTGSSDQHHHAQQKHHASDQNVQNTGPGRGRRNDSRRGAGGQQRHNNDKPGPRTDASDRSKGANLPPTASPVDNNANNNRQQAEKPVAVVVPEPRSERNDLRNDKGPRDGN